MLSVEKLKFHYGQSEILRDVSLRADVGKVSCIIGTNGVGKTSLLKAIAGVKHRTAGAVIFDGAPVGFPPSHLLAKLGIAYVPQGRDIFPLLTVEENLKTGFACLPKQTSEIPDHIFQLFPVLRQMRNRRGGDLSGGQQQQLAIARALITRPKLLLLDEPTEGIQPNVIQQIGEVIDQLRAQNQMAIILVEQYFEFAYARADHFYVLKGGTVGLNCSRGEVSKEALLQEVSV